MPPHRIKRIGNSMNMSSILLAVFVVTLSLGTPLQAVELPQELPLWAEGSPDQTIRHDVKEQVRSVQAQPGSPSGLNRAFSSVSSPTCSIHRPRNPNGVGLVICPGGGFRDVWIDREGHDLAIWLNDHNLTSLVLKYRTRSAKDIRSADAYQNYLRSVRADGRQAIRILRKQADDLGLQPHKIGICGFSAGGHLAINCALHTEPKLPAGKVSGMPDFVGLFYPGIPDDIGQIMRRKEKKRCQEPFLGRSTAAAHSARRSGATKRCIGWDRKAPFAPKDDQRNTKTVPDTFSGNTERCRDWVAERKRCQEPFSCVLDPHWRRIGLTDWKRIGKGGIGKRVRNRFLTRWSRFDRLLAWEGQNEQPTAVWFITF